MEKSYIDPNIVITESLPKNLLWLIDRVEKSDKENKLAYFDQKEARNQKMVTYMLKHQNRDVVSFVLEN